MSAGKEPAKGASAERTSDFPTGLQYVSFSAELAKRKIIIMIKKGIAQSLLFIAQYFAEKKSFSLKGSSNN